MNSYKEIPWLSYRNDIIDFLNLGKDRNPVYGLLEADITKVSNIFSEIIQGVISFNIKKETLKPIFFLGWLWDIIVGSVYRGCKDK